MSRARRPMMVIASRQAPGTSRNAPVPLPPTTPHRRRLLLELTVTSSVFRTAARIWRQRDWGAAPGHADLGGLAESSDFINSKQSLRPKATPPGPIESFPKAVPHGQPDEAAGRAGPGGRALTGQVGKEEQAYAPPNSGRRGEQDS